jgi:hypothetical protein
MTPAKPLPLLVADDVDALPDLEGAAVELLAEGVLGASSVRSSTSSGAE